MTPTDTKSSLAMMEFYKYRPVDKPQYAGKFCDSPYFNLHVNGEGDVTTCCYFHMPWVVGNIYETSLAEIWQGERIQQVRQSLWEGKFTYCNTVCPRLAKLTETPAHPPTLNALPLSIALDIDRSCNLQCASCRENIIIEKNTQRIQQQKALYEEIVHLCRENPDMMVCINPCASGEIFASHAGLYFCEILSQGNLNNLKLNLTTNGTLILRNRELITSLWDKIQKISFSLDAATAETYAEVRGGNWQDVVAGAELLRDKITHISFVVQKKNYHEMEKFVELAQALGVHASFYRLRNWGHWKIKWWPEQDVLDQNSPVREQVLETARKLKQRYGDQIAVQDLEISEDQ
jgi:MoaA/NifB/PqqE/SkfB family radical SAM enzyme